MERRFFSGNTVEQAVMNAARHFDVDPEQVAYTQRQKRHGFLKIRRRVVIEVDPEAPRLSPEQVERRRREEAEKSATQPSAVKATRERTEPVRQAARTAPARPPEREEPAFPPEPPRPTPPRQEEEEKLPATDAEAVAQAVREIALLGSLEVTPEVRREGEGFHVDLEGPDSDLLVEDDGLLLSAIEHLVPRVVRGLRGHGVACKVDAEGFLQEHEEELRQIALDAADAVRESGEPELLDSMSPADRRIIHLTLADEADVETASEGNGYYKRVKVYPAG